MCIRTVVAVHTTRPSERAARVLNGKLLRPSDEGYDALRQGFNGAVDHRPALIVQCHRVEDVIAAVELAREAGLAPSLHSGGHSFAGHSVADSGLMIDLRRLRWIDVDPCARRVAAGPGVTWGELDAATQAHGLAVTGGRVSTTGIAGLTLGGGSGWVERRLGLTCDSLATAQVVTAAGNVVVADDEEHPDLAWALRGGGGNFGVVTRYEYDLHPLGPNVVAGRLLHPRNRAPNLLRSYRDIVADAPDALGGGCALSCPPTCPPSPRKSGASHDRVHGEVGRRPRRR